MFSHAMRSSRSRITHHARTDLWSMASREIDAQTLADLRILLEAWTKARPDEPRVSDMRFADLASPAGGLGAKERDRAAAMLAKERAALADDLAKHREASFADLGREREAMVAGVTKAIEAGSAAAAGEREALAKWATEERTALADDLEARLVKVVDRAIMGAGIVAGVMLVGLLILKFIPSRGTAPKP
jgi:ClpP class serine protease